MITKSYELLNGATANVTVLNRGDIADVAATWKMAAWGTWDSGTAKIQESNDGQTWDDVSGATLSADGCVDVVFTSTAKAFQLVLSGATSPDLNAVMFKWE